MTTFSMVASSGARMILEESRREYKEKIDEMVIALDSLRAIFHGVSYDIRCGVPTEGQSEGFKTVEGVVSLRWGVDVPNSFVIRAYLDAAGEEIPMINGLRQAIGRVYSYCVERAEQPHTAQLQRLLATIIEIRSLLEHLKLGHHTELLFKPNTGNANVCVLCWIDGEQFDGMCAYHDDELRTMRDNLMGFVGDRLGRMMDEGAAARQANETADEPQTPEVMVIEEITGSMEATPSAPVAPPQPVPANL